MKSSADKEDKNTSTKHTKSVKVYVLEKDRNTILSNGRLDDNFINESQNILKKQFPNIGGWKDTLLCQTSFSAVSEESVQITTLGKIVVNTDQRTFAGLRQFAQRGMVGLELRGT